jgi:hypothetical protein
MYHMIPDHVNRDSYVTELILGREGLGEKSNYDYSKLKRKGKERKSNTSYFIINIGVCAR